LAARQAAEEATKHTRNSTHPHFESLQVKSSERAG